MLPRKILAMKLRSLGDTVLMTAPLEALRTAYPEAELHLAVIGHWAPLFENHPALSRIWTYERHKEKAARAKAICRLALNLRKERFDLVVNFHASPSSATIAFATGARTRSIHFHGHRDKNRYSTVVIPGKGVLKPIIERDMDALRALGLEIPTGKLPILRPHPQEVQTAKEWLSSLGLPDPVLGLGLGASRPTKCWSPSRFAELAVAWNRETGGGVLVLAGPEDDATAAAFSTELAKRQDADTRISVQKRKPVRKLMAVLKHLAVFCGNDSGPRHVAVGVDTPTVTLFGPEDPYEWHPYPQERHPRLFIEELSCRKDALPGFRPWCGLEVCVEEKHRCMEDIPMSQVLEACLKVRRAAS